jgi:glutathione S-transferase
MRKLWFSEGSPFARKVRIVLAEKGLEYQKDVLNGIRPEDTHRTIHPGLMVPVLIDGDITLFESNLIIDYLLRTYPENPSDMPQPPLVPSLTRPERHWEDAKMLAILESLGNSIANFKLMRDEGATPERFPYLQRQLNRIESCLDWLEERATADGFMPGWFSIMDINLICPVLYAEKRKVIELCGRPKLASIIARFSDRPSIASTPVSAAGGRAIQQPDSG